MYILPGIDIKWFLISTWISNYQIALHHQFKYVLGNLQLIINLTVYWFSLFPHYVQVWRRNVWTAWYLKPSFPNPWCNTTSVCYSNTAVSSCPDRAGRVRATSLPGWLSTWWTAAPVRSLTALWSLSTCTASHARWQRLMDLNNSGTFGLCCQFSFRYPLTPFLSVSAQDLQLYLSNLANQIDRETSTSEIPLVVILDDIHDPASISELVNGALTCKYHKW